MTIAVETGPGLISDSIRKMIDLAKVAEETVSQELNGADVHINGDSDFDSIYRDQQRAQSGYIEGQVGPYPKDSLSASDIASDKSFEAQQQARTDNRMKAAAAKRESDLKIIEASIKDYPLEVNQEEWKEGLANQSDSYGKRVYSYAETWARLMQSEISQGKKLEDIVKSTASLADTDGITGFMFGAAVSTLAYCDWTYGEELLSLHKERKT